VRDGRLPLPDSAERTGMPSFSVERLAPESSAQLDGGASGKPAAYVIPAAQHDPLTAQLMINKLLGQGIEIKQAAKPFSLASGMTYATGSFVVSMAQPKIWIVGSASDLPA